MAKTWKILNCSPTSYDLLWHFSKIFGNNNSIAVHHFHFSILVPPLVYLFCFVYYLALLFHNQDHQYYCHHGHLKGIFFYSSQKNSHMKWQFFILNDCKHNDEFCNFNKTKVLKSPVLPQKSLFLHYEILPFDWKPFP